MNRPNGGNYIKPRTHTHTHTEEAHHPKQKSLETKTEYISTLEGAGINVDTLYMPSTTIQRNKDGRARTGFLFLTSKGERHSCGNWRGRSSAGVRGWPGAAGSHIFLARHTRTHTHTHTHAYTRADEHRHGAVGRWKRQRINYMGKEVNQRGR